MAPVIDRRFLPDRLGKVGKRSSKVFVFAMVLVAVLMFGAIAGLMVHIGNSGEPHASVTHVITSVETLLTTHNPIKIVGDGNFTSANGVVSGSGTTSDPYIIANWDINASTASMNMPDACGIWIQDTDAHFIVRNCFVHDGLYGSNYYDGISLLSCANDTLENNTCWNDYDGIWVDASSNITLINNDCNSNNNGGVYMTSSSNNTLSDNNCSNDDYGMYLGVSNNNTLTNNTCNSNADVGTYLTSSNNNTLSNNKCLNNRGLYSTGYGIDLASSSNNTLTKNNCSSNYLIGINLESSSNNILSDNDCSWSSDGACVDLLSSSNNRLSNNTCSNGNIGIFLGGSSNNTVINNNCSSNAYNGIDIWSSSDKNTISWNQMWSNSGYGEFIYSGSNNSIWNNTFIGNNGAGSIYSSGHIQAYDDGTNNWWNSTNGYGNYWSDWTTPDANHDGIVDVPYSIAGSAGAKDYYPLTNVPVTQIPEFGMLPLVVIALMAVIVITEETRRKKKS